MNLKLSILLLVFCYITVIKCWVELDIDGNDMSKRNPSFVSPDEDCDDDQESGLKYKDYVDEGTGGGQSRYKPKKPRPTRRRVNRRNGKQRLRSRDLQNAFKEVKNYAAMVDKNYGKDLKSYEEDCVTTSPKSVVELPQQPQLRMIRNDTESEKEVTEKQDLGTTECTEIVDLEPKTSVKVIPIIIKLFLIPLVLNQVETYTVPYEVTQVRYRTLTRKTVYIQRRRKVKRTMNKPILVIRRKLVKDKQTFERIVPKIIETREVINKPQVEYKIIEGPMEEVGATQPHLDGDCEDEDLLTTPMMSSAENPPQEQEIHESADMGAAEPPAGAPAPPDDVVPPNPNVADAPVQVSNDFNSALGDGIQHAFNQDGGPAHARSLDGGTTYAPESDGYAPGGASIYARPSVNAYGQPVYSFAQ